jgi:hypothetical protein
MMIILAAKSTKKICLRREAEPYNIKIMMQEGTYYYGQHKCCFNIIPLVVTFKGKEFRSEFARALNMFHY